MSPRPIVRTIFDFLAGIMHRDRYLVELLAAVVTFGVGVIASMTQDSLVTRQSLAGFRDMPCPEGLVILFALPGIWAAVTLLRDGERHEGRVSLMVMLSFVALAILALVTGLENWPFWTLFALLLGVMKSYALILEWSYLRWGVSCLGAFFWISISLSIAVNTADMPLAFAPYAGFAAANLLGVWRARGRRHG